MIATIAPFNCTGVHNPLPSLVKAGVPALGRVVGPSDQPVCSFVIGLGLWPPPPVAR